MADPGRPVRFRTLVVTSVTVASLLFGSLANASPIVSWSVWQKALKIHRCEQPNWHAKGPIYSGGLGWHNGLWLKYRAPWMPTNMGDAKPLWQAWALAHFIADENGGYWPDQFGCSGSY